MYFATVFLHTEIGFLLRGDPYPNHSVVTLADIGRDSAALLCFTSFFPCCRSEGGNPSRGSWRFPDGHEIAFSSTSSDNIFSRSRRSNTVLLHRGESASEPIGVFTCTIPDDRGVDQEVLVGIYPPDAGTMDIEFVLHCGLFVSIPPQAPPAYQLSPMMSHLV